MKRTIEKLTEYLPRFEKEPYEKKTDNWWPSYSRYVEDFFDLVQCEFDDRDYALNDHEVLAAQLADGVYISNATVEQCRTLLTFIMCGEKFSDGWWRKNIEEGRVQAILKRLKGLSSQSVGAPDERCLGRPDRFKHGPIDCRQCFPSSDSSTLVLGDWRLNNNPGYYGSANPEVLILGFSKGATQNKAQASEDFDSIAFAGMRDRLQAVLEVLHLMPGNCSLNDMLMGREERFGFASLVRCSLYKMVKGKATTSGPVVTSAFKQKEALNIIESCARTYLRDLPSSLRLTLLLGTNKTYMRNVKAIFSGMYDSFEDINEVAFYAGNVLWVFVAHPSPANGHFRAWLSEGDVLNQSSSKRVLAAKAINMYLDDVPIAAIGNSLVGM